MFCVAGYLVCVYVACFVKNEVNVNVSLVCPSVKSQDKTVHSMMILFLHNQTL